LKYREEGYLRSEIDTEVMPVDSDSTRVNLIVSVDEGPKLGINRIVILGNEKLSDRQIRRVMETGTGFLFFSRGDYDRKKVEDDKQLIAARYREAGYWDAKVVSDSLGYDRRERNITLFLTVEEGQQYILRSLTWTGIELLDQSEVDAVVTVRPPEPFNEAKLSETIALVQGLYFEQGYVYSNLHTDPSFDSTFVDIEMHVSEGEPANVAHIFITGNTRTKEHVIRRELLLKPGNLFSRDLFERSLREVMALNYFNNVELDPPPTPTLDGNIDVTIKVTERPTGQAMFGAGYSERDGIIGNIGLMLPNLFGNGQQLDFTWDFGRIRRTIQFGFTEPWLFNTPTLVGFNVYRSQLFWNIFYKQKREGFGLRLGRRLKWPDDYFRTSIGYRIEDTTFYDF
ncbi:MAG: BamA/TamA family outer membrane protein, partial [Candidatus Krumholzibacteria bacterium]|nr:BamA/TamA family outer membrane protein [Candidatus Krumholzibacteria bacterium]